MKELEPQLILVKHEIKKNNIDQNILPWQYVWLPRNKLFFIVWITDKLFREKTHRCACLIVGKTIIKLHK